MDMTQAMNEAVRVYTLFRKLDRDRSGRVDRNEFLFSLKEHKVEDLSASQCATCGKPLKEVPSMPFWQSLANVRVCNRCNRDLARGEPSWSCETCGQDLCKDCRASLMANNYS